MTAATGRKTLCLRSRATGSTAGVVAALLLAGIVWFVTFEQTAITTLPR